MSENNTANFDDIFSLIPKPISWNIEQLIAGFRAETAKLEAEPTAITLDRVHRWQQTLGLTMLPDVLGGHPSAKQWQEAFVAISKQAIKAAQAVTMDNEPPYDNEWKAGIIKNMEERAEQGEVLMTEDRAAWRLLVDRRLERGIAEVPGKIAKSS